jgi:hypothetical protein
LVLIGQGIERPAAVLVELAEILQALETQVVDVAAEQVQREVQRVAQQGDEQENEDVAGMAPSVLNTWAMTLPESIRAIRRE